MEKNKKMKTKMVAIVLAIVLLGGVFVAVGYTLAAIKELFNFGGSVGFEANNVYAAISEATLTGGNLEDSENKMQTILFDMNTDPTGEKAKASLETWSDLNVSLLDTGEDMVVTFYVTNLHTEKNLKFSWDSSSSRATYVNCEPSMLMNGEHVNSGIVETNGGEIQVVLRLTVTDKNESASMSNFSFQFSLECTEEEANTSYAGLFNDEGELLTSWDDLISTQMITMDSDGTITSADKSIAGNLVISNNVATIGERAFRQCEELTGLKIASTRMIYSTAAAYIAEIFSDDGEVCSEECALVELAVNIYNEYNISIPVTYDECAKAFAENEEIDGIESFEDYLQWYNESENESLTAEELKADFKNDAPFLVETDELEEYGLGKRDKLLQIILSGISEYELAYYKGAYYVDEDAFYGCSGLTSIELGDSVCTADTMAFWILGDNLAYMKIGGGLASLGEYKLCFLIGASYNLTSIVVDPNNPFYDSRENCNAIIETASNTLICGCNNTTIPNSVVKIYHGAFVYSNMAEITIPGSVTYIGTQAFTYSNIAEITIPESVTYIGGAAFLACNNLKNVTFECTDGWTLGEDSDYGKNDNYGKTIEGLEDSENAATLIAHTYGGYEWIRGE